MYSSVKNSCKRDIGVNDFQPWALTLHTKEGGQGAGSTEAQAQPTDILYVIRFLQKNT